MSQLRDLIFNLQVLQIPEDPKNETIAVTGEAGVLEEDEEGNTRVAEERRGKDVEEATLDGKMISLIVEVGQIVHCRLPLTALEKKKSFQNSKRENRCKYIKIQSKSYPKS